MRGEAGMSVLEVLIALAILGLAGLLMSEGVAFGTRTSDRVEARAGDAAARLDGARLLRRLVETAEPPGPFADSASFVGGAARLEFLSLESARLAAGAPRRVAISLDVEAARVVARLTDPSGREAEEEIVLFEGARALRLVYRRGDGARLERWSDAARLPGAVELEILFAADAPALRLSAVPRRRLAAECLVHGLAPCREALK